MQRFRVARPVAAALAQQQEGGRVLVQRDGDGQGQGQGGNEGFFDRGTMRAGNDDDDEEEEEGLPGRGPNPEEIGAELSRLMGRGEPVEREVRADDAREMDDDEETVVDESEQGRWYVGPPPF